MEKLSVDLLHYGNYINSEKKSFQLYNQVCFVYGWNGGLKYDNPNSYYSDQAELQFHSGTGVKDEIGASFRTGRFVADLGFSFGKIKYNNVVFTRDLSAPVYIPINLEEDFHPNMPTNTIFLTAGIGF